MARVFFSGLRFSGKSFFKFKYEHTDCFWIDVEAIISTVTLSRDPLTKVYEIDHVDGMALDEFVARQT